MHLRRLVQRAGVVQRLSRGLATSHASLQGAEEHQWYCRRDCAPLYVRSRAPLDSGTADVQHRASQYAAILSNSQLPPAAFSIWHQARLRLCADGGANLVHRESRDGTAHVLPPDVIIGDLDSAHPDVLRDFSARGTKIEKNSCQDSTDMEKCLQYVERWEKDEKIESVLIMVLGGLGGNISHELSNLHLLYRHRRRPIAILSRDNLAFLLDSGRHTIFGDRTLLPAQHANVEKHRQMHVHCSLIPLGAPCPSARTTGLRWNLRT